MYRNQYFATTGTAEVPSEDWSTHSLGPLRVMTHASLEVAYAGSRSEVLLLGILIDPYAPKRSGQQLADELASTCETRGELFNRVSRLGGRFVLFCRIGNDLLAISDACGFRNVIYGETRDGLHLGSNLKLCLDVMGMQEHSREGVAALFQSERFDREEHAWFGDLLPDRRFRKMLPNHYLDLLARKVVRIPAVRYPEPVDPQRIMKTAEAVLRGSIEALGNRYRLIQGLSAGYDSRMLLAASKPWSDSIWYYTMAPQGTEDADLKVARRLASSLHLNFDEHRLRPLDAAFKTHFEANHLHPRLLKNARYIQALARRWEPGQVVNITGNGAEIVRCFYGHSKRRIPEDMLRSFSGYGSTVSFVNDAIHRWTSEARAYAKSQNVSLLDLFYWEQRMGNARFPSELDMLMEEVSPFNQREMLLQILRIPADERKAPGYTFFRRLTHNLWPQTQAEPINPQTSRWKTALLSHARFRYYALKLLRPG